jgi:hypothetical protein
MLPTLRYLLNPTGLPGKPAGFPGMRVGAVAKCSPAAAARVASAVGVAPNNEALSRKDWGEGARQAEAYDLTDKLKLELQQTS